MKSIKTFAIVLLSAVIFMACGGKTKNESSEDAKETCTYSYNSDSTTLKWTAYKFTKRAGVSGTFDEITVSNTKSAENPLDVLVGANFSLVTSSVNSGNAERDPKLVVHFFNKLISTEIITGKIVSVANNETVVSLTMNEKTVDAIGKVTVDGEMVSMEMAIDMADFEGLDAIASLNEVCSAKHTDEDGESKLWPDVSIIVSTVLKKECK